MSAWSNTERTSRKQAMCQCCVEAYKYRAIDCRAAKRLALSAVVDASTDPEILDTQGRRACAAELERQATAVAPDCRQKAEEFGGRNKVLFWRPCLA